MTNQPPDHSALIDYINNTYYEGKKRDAVAKSLLSNKDAFKTSLNKMYSDKYSEKLSREEFESKYIQKYGDPFEVKKKDLGTAPSSVSSSQKVNEEIPTASREELQSMLDRPDIKEKLNPDPVYQELLNKDTALTSFSKDYKEKKEVAQETEQAEKVLSDAIKAVAPQGPGYDYTLSPGVNAWNSFMGGALKTFSGLPKSVGVLSKNMDWFNEYTDKEATDLATYKAGQWLEDTANELFPTNPELRENFLATTLPQAGGNMAAFIAGGAGGRAIKAGSGVTVGLLGATQTAASEYDAALQSGAAPDDAFNVFLMNLPVGAAEGVPVAKFFGRLNRVTNGAISGHFAKTGMSRFFNSATGEVVAGGLEEMTQEIGSQMASNFVAQNTYDNTRQLIEGVKEGGAAGFILGALMNGIGISLRNRLNDPSVSPEQRKEDLATIKYLEEEQAKIQSGEEILNVTPKEEELHKKKLDLEKDLAKPEVSEAVKAEIKKEVQSINQEIKAVEEARIAKDIEEGKAKHTVEALEDEKQSIEKELESKEISDQTKKVLESRISQIEAEKKTYQPGDVVELSPEKAEVPDLGTQESQAETTQEAEDQSSQNVNNSTQEAQKEEVVETKNVSSTTKDALPPSQENRESLLPKEGDSFEVKSKHTGDPIQFTYKAGQWTFKDSKGKEQVESPKSQEKRTEEWREQNGVTQKDSELFENPEQLKSEPFENIEQLPEPKQLDGLAVLDKTKKVNTTPKADATIVPPPTSKSDIPASEGSNNLKERKGIKNLVNKGDVSDKFKEDLSSDIKYYEVDTVKDAEKQVEEIISKRGVDGALKEALNKKNKMSDFVRPRLIHRLMKEYDSLAEKAAKEGNIELEKQYRSDAYVATQQFAESTTGGAKTIAALRGLYADKTPSQVLYETEQEVGEQQAKELDKRKKTINQKKKAIKEAEKEAGKEAAKSKRAKSFIDKVRGKKKEEVKEKKTPDKEVKKDITRKKIEEGKAQAKAELDALFKEMSSRASSGIDPVVTAKIVKAATKYGYYTIADGYYNFKDWSAKMKKELGDQVGPYLEEVWSGEYEGENLKKLAGEVGAYKIEKNPGKEIKANLDERLEKIAEKHFSEVEKSKEDLVNKIVDGLELPVEQAEKLAIILEEEFDKIITDKKRQMLNKSLSIKEKMSPRKTKELHDEIIRLSNLGALTDEQFAQLYAEKMGLPHLTEIQKKQILNLAGKVQNTKDGFDKRRALSDLLKYQQTIKGIKWSEVALSLWYASVLSGPTTHALNTYANTANIISRFYLSTVRHPRQIPSIAKALVNGLKRGHIEFKAAWDTGVDPEKGVGKFDLPPILERVKFKEFLPGLDIKELKNGNIKFTLWNPLNKAKYVQRLMIGVDIMAYHGLKEMRGYQLALIKAGNEGKSSPSMETRNKAYNELYNTDKQWSEAKSQAAEEGFTGVEQKRRAYEILEKNRDEVILEEAHQYALQGTFNQDPKGIAGVVVGGISYITEGISIKGYKPAKHIVPFAKIIANVVNDYAEWMPLIAAYRYAKGGVGFSAMKDSDQFKKYYKEYTDAEKADLIIKGLTGLAVMVALWNMSDDENGWVEITGNGTGDYKKNYELEDWQEYSFRLKGTDKWISYQNTPLAFVFVPIGFIRDDLKYGKRKSWEENEANYGKALYSSVKFIFDATFLSSVSEFMDIFAKEGDYGANNAERKLLKFAIKTSKSFIAPSILTQTSKIIDEITKNPVRRADNWWEEYYKDIIGFNRFLKPLLDTRGRPVEPEILHKLVPLQINEKYKKTEVGQLLNKHNIFIGSHTKPQVESMLKIALTNDEYNDFVKTRSELIEEAMTTHVKLLKEMEPEMLKDFVNNFKKLATERAKMELFLKKKK